jgi:hypothetical protein
MKKPSEMDGEDGVAIVALPQGQSSYGGSLRNLMFQKMVERWSWAVVRVICVGFYLDKDLKSPVSTFQKSRSIGLLKNSLMRQSSMFTPICVSQVCSMGRFSIWLSMATACTASWARIALRS